MNILSAIASAIASGQKVISHEDAETYEVGNQIIKVMVLKEGMGVVKHLHSYTHAHILGKGRILLEIDGEFREYSAPAVIEVEANKYHGIFALEDSVGFCVHDKTQLET